MIAWCHTTLTSIVWRNNGDCFKEGATLPKFQGEFLIKCGNVSDAGTASPDVMTSGGARRARPAMLGRGFASETTSRRCQSRGPCLSVCFWLRRVSQSLPAIPTRISPAKNWSVGVGRSVGILDSGFGLSGRTSDVGTSRSGCRVN